MRLITDILETLYPTCCPGCGHVVDPNVQWCEACLRKIWNPRLLNSSFTDHLSGCYTCCDYAGAIRDCIIQIKYGGRRSRKRVFAPLLSRFPWWDRMRECGLVIPIPLSSEKKKWRGYNQVDLMFAAWMKEAGYDYRPDALVRIRSAHTQSLLSRKERFQNIKGVFHIARSMDVKGETILVVDDIYTTGATMEAAAHELMRAGAKKVMGMTIASGAS